MIFILFIVYSLVFSYQAMQRKAAYYLADLHRESINLKEAFNKPLQKSNGYG